MTALLNFIPLEKIIVWLLALLKGVTMEQWARTLDLVIEAAKTYREDSDKKFSVSNQLKIAWPTLKDGSIELLRALAVQYLKKKGLI